MLYDVFICHASEDKSELVRPLADALRGANIEVWYDEFSLSLGDSIRRSIDKGLSQSRFGIIVLSQAFFAKQWTQYELDGLTELEIQGKDKVLLPIWHGITQAQVLAYSPSLAGRKAALTAGGLSSVVDEIVRVVRPQGSPFIAARDELIEWGITPPVITDEYWLDVVEASNRIPGFGGYIPEESTWGRWSFPLPHSDMSAKGRGLRLAWTAMQLAWVAVAESMPVTPLSPPDIVHEFINDHPGLLETCEDFPNLIIEYAPQLAIPGFEGNLKVSIEEAFQKSCAERHATGISNPQFGSGLTVGGVPPACDEEWSIRHPKFGNFEPRMVWSAYFHGGMFGPTVSPFSDSTHLVWLLSRASAWLPARIRACMVDGASSSVHWSSNTPKKASSDLFMALHDAMEEKREFRWTKPAEESLLELVEMAIEELKLPESPYELIAEFEAANIANRSIWGELSMDIRRQARRSK